jgi:hypothetical protein
MLPLLLSLDILLAPPEEVSITVHCDPRVELLMTVFRIAGAEEYRMDAAGSPYSREVDQWFQPFAKHAAIRIVREQRAERGVSHDAVPGLAVHLDDLAHLELRVPLDPWPEKLDQRWTAESLAQFLPALRDFARETRFTDFFAQHRSLYEETAKRVKAAVAEAKLESWVRDFFGPGASAASFTMIPGLLCGGGNYGSSVRLPDGRLELMPVLGIWSWDEKGLPLFGPDHLPTVAHEFTHTFANPMIDHHADDFEEAGVALFRTVAQQMQSQAYANWRTMLYESLVRGCVVRYVARTQGGAKAEAQAREEESRGFRWTGELAELLETYEKERAKYADLDAFVPHLVAFFDAQAEKIANLPVVVSIEPADGATDVDPATPAIRVTFDRPMQDGSWSVTGSGPQVPPANGKPSYDADRKVFTLPVKLEPGKTYRFALNGPNHTGFKSEDGSVLPPMLVTFTTRAK